MIMSMNLNNQNNAKLITRYSLLLQFLSLLSLFEIKNPGWLEYFNNYIIYLSISMILYKNRYYSNKLIIPKSIWSVSIINNDYLQILNQQRLEKNLVHKVLYENFSN